MQRNFDLVLLGATGYTGKNVIPFLHKFTKAINLTWGIAGRSEEKLQGLRQEWQQRIGNAISEIPILVADIENQKSLNEIASQARIILNCCGPYRFFGEPVVKACIEEGTHYVDVSGEPQFMEEMQLKYSEKAKHKGVYIISACGIDSIPSDLGVVFLQKKFDGTLNSVVAYMETWEEKPVKGPHMNYATWESAVYGLAHANELGAIRRKLFHKKLPNFKPKLQLISRPHRSNLVEGWAVPFPGADRSVVTRSQRFFYELDKRRPIQVEPYFVLKSFYTIPKLAASSSILQALVKTKRGQELLLQHPEKFSDGVFDKSPPREEKVQNQHFALTLYGEGWKEKFADADHQYSVPPNMAICGKVTARNPSYGATCVCLVLSAITVLTECDKMPSSGGVYPPGYAFANTTLVDQLIENEVRFEIVFKKDLLSAKY